MDRVDRWLNEQRGWRRLLIGWLVLAPALLDLGLLWSGSGNIDGQATVPTGSVLVHVAIAALAGIPLAAGTAGLQRWSRKSRPWAPGFQWRMTLANYSLMAGIGVMSYGWTRTEAWRHQHPSYNAAFVADAVAFVLLIWSALYYWKLRRQANASAQDATNG